MGVMGVMGETQGRAPPSVSWTLRSLALLAASASKASTVDVAEAKRRARERGAGCKSGGHAHHRGNILRAASAPSLAIVFDSQRQISCVNFGDAYTVPTRLVLTRVDKRIALCF
jgi:hypothetical protein